MSESSTSEFPISEFPISESSLSESSLSHFAATDTIIEIDLSNEIADIAGELDTNAGIAIENLTIENLTISDLAIEVAAIEATDPSVAWSAPPASKLRVLIVDSQEKFAPVLQYQLELFGYSVSGIAQTSFEALQQATDCPPNLVMVDVQLQDDLNSIELAKELWANFGLPIVYVADRETVAEGDQPILWQCNQMPQAYGMLFQPLDELDVLNAVQNAMNRHRKETELQVTIAQQQAHTAMKSRLVSLMAHEFRNPLNAILFSTELLQKYGEQVSEEKRASYYDRINTSVQRMNQLLEDVLMIEATETGQMYFHPFPVDAVAFCKEVIQEFQPYTGDIVEFMGEITIAPLVSLDEKLLRHVLNNLISNAIKYSPQGAIVEFHLTLNEQQAIFRVRDQGIGITPEDQTKLFTAFHRGSNARRIPGTGLGLSIVKQCVELHGGEIHVISEPGHGSTFEVIIPLTASDK
jgi:signal transduction histidine kinase